MFFTSNLDHLLGGLDDDEVGGQVDPQRQRARAHQNVQEVPAEQCQPVFNVRVNKAN